jgi:hypothetical protein
MCRDGARQPRPAHGGFRGRPFTRNLEDSERSLCARGRQSVQAGGRARRADAGPRGATRRYGCPVRRRRRTTVCRRGGAADSSGLRTRRPGWRRVACPRPRSRSAKRARRLAVGLILSGALACTALLDLDYELESTVTESLTCTAGSRSCDGDRVITCGDGRWAPSATCGGASPVCSGGVCAPWRLSGGLTSAAETPSSGAVRLTRASWEQLGARCTRGASPVCLAGGFVP